MYFQYNKACFYYILLLLVIFVMEHCNFNKLIPPKRVKVFFWLITHRVVAIRDMSNCKVCRSKFGGHHTLFVELPANPRSLDEELKNLGSVRDWCSCIEHNNYLVGYWISRVVSWVEWKYSFKGGAWNCTTFRTRRFILHTWTVRGHLVISGRPYSLASVGI